MTGNADSGQQRPWPDEVEAFLPSDDGDGDGGGVSTRSASGPAQGSGLATAAQRWVVGSATVYRFDQAESLRIFVEAVEALDRVAPFSIAPVVGSFERWLVIGSPPGEPGHRPDLHADPDDLVGALGEGLRQLHDLTPPDLVVTNPVPSGPDGYARPDVIVDRCTAAVEAGLVETAALPSPYDRYSPQELLALFVEGRPDPIDADEPPVWCHGSVGAERFVVEGGSFTGFDRMENPVLADRHLDLATMHRSVQDHFGPEAVFRFYEAYGRDPNLVLLDHYILASHLMGHLLGHAAEDRADESQASPTR